MKRFYIHQLKTMKLNPYKKNLLIDATLGYGRPDNVEGTVTRLRSSWSGVQIPVRTRDFPLFRTVQNGTGAHPASYLVGTAIPSR
jgi:hypothetical protein